MGKYTDDEICNAAKITIKIAVDYLSISPNILTLGMRNNLLPIGYTDRWTFQPRVWVIGQRSRLANR